MTQGERILEYIDTNGSITPFEAFTELGITKLATRISELRRCGEKIEKRYVTGTNRFGEKIQYMEYRR